MQFADYQHNTFRARGRSPQKTGTFRTSLAGADQLRGWGTANVPIRADALAAVHLLPLFPCARDSHRCRAAQTSVAHGRQLRSPRRNGQCLPCSTNPARLIVAGGFMINLYMTAKIRIFEGYRRTNRVAWIKDSRVVSAKMLISILFVVYDTGARIARA